MSQITSYQDQLKANVDQIQARVVALLIEKEAVEKQLVAVSTELSERLEQIKIIQNVQAAVTTSSKLMAEKQDNAHAPEAAPKLDQKT